MTWPLRITALDLSLTGTGICHVHGGEVEHLETVRTGRSGHERMSWILNEVGRWSYRVAEPQLVLIEGPAYGAAGGQSGHHERAGLWWLVAHRLWSQGVPYVVISPTGRAKYAAGRGGAGKDEVLIAAVKRFGHLAEIRDNNQADALILAAMAADHYGAPLAEVPAVNRTALAAVKWPDLLIEEGAA